MDMPVRFALIWAFVRHAAKCRHPFLPNPASASDSQRLIATSSRQICHFTGFESMRRFFVSFLLHAFHKSQTLNKNTGIINESAIIFQSLKVCLLFSFLSYFFCIVYFIHFYF
jgi:hypothetical protein